LDLDLIINPEQTAAYEIARIFSFPNAHSVESFYRGQVTMVGVNTSKNDAVDGMKISDIAKKFGYSFIVCAVERGSEIFIPGGKFIVQGGDILYLMGNYAKVNKFCNLIENQVHRIKDVMIIGGGRITYYLVEAIKDMGINVKIIEEHDERCIQLTELLQRVLVINGDGTDETLLEAENLDEMDAFVALTGWDEDNLMTSLYAKRAGVPKVIAKITKVNYSSVIKDLGISAVIDSKKLITNLIVRYINGLKKESDSNLETIYPILGGRAQVLVYKVGKGMDFIGIPIRKLDLGDEMVIGAIIRHNDILYPDGDQIIEVGDKIIAISKDEEYDYDDELFDGE
jgi:trk system potassium uptake protein TrkA